MNIISELAIFKIPMGVTNSYILRNPSIKKSILIDAGEPGKLELFKSALAKKSLNPKEISLIILTHGHWDHIGSLMEIKNLTGAKVAIHKDEREWAEKGQKHRSPSHTLRGRILSLIISSKLKLLQLSPCPIDIEINNDGLSLEEYGISASVYHTPGHSNGSVSIVTKQGDAFVGDLAMNRFPLSYGPNLPLFFNNFDQLRQSWKNLLKIRLKMIYPGHGDEFQTERINEILASL